jgi:hypothetical protein
MAIVGVAQGADLGRKEEALAFLKGIGGGVRVSEELGRVLQHYAPCRAVTTVQCLLTILSLVNSNRPIKLNFSSIEGWEYTARYENDIARYEDDKLKFNIDFELVEKAEKKRLNEEALAFLKDKPFPRVQKILKRELGL